MNAQSFQSAVLRKFRVNGGNQIEQILLLLSEREKFVIQKRFNLDNTNRATLQEIGSHFQVTRERVRQIEKSALQKLERNIEKFELFELNTLAFHYLQKSGGVLKEDMMLSKLMADSNVFSAGEALLLLNVDRRFEYISNTVEYYPYFKLRTIPDYFLQKVIDKSSYQLRKKKSPFLLEKLVSIIHNEIPETKIYSRDTFIHIYQLHKNFKFFEGKLALLEWRSVHPRTLRDKIYYVLRRVKKPLHFIEVANAIMDSQFDHKKINLQAVHNELIRYPDFVLIGRGIYALREWGYSPGTVADIITKILTERKTLSEEDIISEVLKLRKVKPITVLLNLKNKPQFTRVGRKQYALK